MTRTLVSVVAIALAAPPTVDRALESDPAADPSGSPS